MIKKKTWPGLFQRVADGEKNTEVRLADFELKKGELLVLEEYDPLLKRYTGRSITRKVKNLMKVNFTDFHTLKEISTFGHYIIEMEAVK